MNFRFVQKFMKTQKIENRRYFTQKTKKKACQKRTLNGLVVKIT